MQESLASSDMACQVQVKRDRVVAQWTRGAAGVIIGLTSVLTSLEAFHERCHELVRCAHERVPGRGPKNLGIVGRHVGWERQALIHGVAASKNPVIDVSVPSGPYVANDAPVPTMVPSPSTMFQCASDRS